MDWVFFFVGEYDVVNFVEIVKLIKCMDEVVVFFFLEIIG